VESDHRAIFFILVALIALLVFRLRHASKKSKVLGKELSDAKKELSDAKYEVRREQSEHASEMAHLEREHFAQIKKHGDASAEEISAISRQRDEALQLYNDVQRLLMEQSQHFPWLSTAYADYQALLFSQAENSLRYKTRAAPSSADKVREMRERVREVEWGFRKLKYRLDFLEKYFPWISEVVGDSLEEILVRDNPQVRIQQEESQDDPVLGLLSESEYRALSVAERNQLALDRWTKSRKSSWQIGREYERFIGYTFEVEGYRVEYFGAVKGFEDLGRDLIVKKSGKTSIIQCKYWSKDKSIHEKHIFQLFGSVVEYIARINSAGQTAPLFGKFVHLAEVKPVFITSASLSPVAKEFADLLEVEVREGVPLGEYPRIKCNVSRRGGEKLYHLPFDQQYDRTVVDLTSGEFYAATVKEAESRGFRRAYRWHTRP
jgi:hypothetical protein